MGYLIGKHVGYTYNEEATGDGSVIAILKRIRTQLGNFQPESPTIVSYTSTTFSVDEVTETQEIVAAPGSGKQIWVYGLFLVGDTTGTQWGFASLQDEDENVISGLLPVIYLASRMGAQLDWVWPLTTNLLMPYVKAPTNKAVYINCGDNTLSGHVCYAIVTV